MTDDNISNLFGDDEDDDFEDFDEDDEDGLLSDELWDMLGEMDFAGHVAHLTVSEGKRLIAKAVAADPRVQTAMMDGTVAVCKGSTNAYVLEELLEKDIEKAKYVLGKTLPAKSETAPKAFRGSIPEVIFVDGEPVPGLTLDAALERMGPGDVVLKGANAIDYQNSLAGLLIGHPSGGTMGKIIGHVYGKGLALIVPAGLEKVVAGPLREAAGICRPPLMSLADAPRLWVFEGVLFTEIEALWTLADVESVQIGAGGVCGAEGAVWLYMTGMEEDITKARHIIDVVQGEPSFWDAVMGD